MRATIVQQYILLENYPISSLKMVKVTENKVQVQVMEIFVKIAFIVYTHTVQKKHFFRQINVCTKQVTKELISRIFWE